MLCSSKLDGSTSPAVSLINTFSAVMNIASESVVLYVGAIRAATGGRIKYNNMSFSFKVFISKSYGGLL